MDRLKNLKIYELKLIEQLSSGNIEKAKEYYENYSELFEEITGEKTCNSFEDLVKISKNSISKNNDKQ